MADGMFTLWTLPATDEEVVCLLQEFGIIPAGKKCKNGHEMSLSFGRTVRWRCFVRQCRSEIAVRKGTWLEHSNLPLVNVIRFIYAWSKNLSSIAFCEHELKMSKKVVVAWNHLLREVVCVELSKTCGSKIGGMDQVVELEELLLFSKPRKQWVIAGLSRHTKDSFIVLLKEQSAATLLDIITTYVNEGTTIYTNCFKTYKTEELEAAGYLQMSENYGYRFIDPQMGVDTQNIERLSSLLKAKHKMQRGTAEQHRESLICECIWRHRLQDRDPFVAILKSIAKEFPPEVTTEFSPEVSREFVKGEVSNELSPEVSTEFSPEVSREFVKREMSVELSPKAPEESPPEKYRKFQSEIAKEFV